MPRKGQSKYQSQFTAGQMFGQWTIMTGEVYVKHDAHVMCRCSCGNEVGVSVLSLLKGVSKCCKECARRNSREARGANNHNWRGLGEIGSSKFKRVKNQEERVALAETWENCGGLCALTGWPISLSDGTASPDRIDSTKGYEHDNIQWVHTHVNVAKNIFDMDHFISICHAVAANHKNPNKRTSDIKFGTRNEKKT